MAKLIDEQLANIEKVYEGVATGGKVEFSKSALEDLYQIIKELKDYRTLDELGRLVIIGEIVYEVTKKACTDCQFFLDYCSISLDCPKEILEVKFEKDMINKLNKTIFLTKEDAEKHL